MALWVQNNYKTTFVIKWDGTEYIINPGDDNLLLEDVVKAHFPTYDDLQKFLPRDEVSAIREMRNLVDVYLSRWGPQISKHYKLTGNIEVDIDNFFKFLSGFQISEKKFGITEEK